MAHVLIVEDEWLIAMQYMDLLREAGHSVAGPFAQVAPALKAVEDQGIHAALLDVSLGTETSLPVARLLCTRRIPFAFLTGDPGRTALSDFGAAPVLSKPVAEDDLLAVLGRLCPP